MIESTSISITTYKEGKILQTRDAVHDILHCKKSHNSGYTQHGGVCYKTTAYADNVKQQR